MITIAITQAKIGRLIKNFAISPLNLLLRSLCRFGLFLLGHCRNDLDGNTRADSLQTFDDNLFTRLQTLLNNPF